MGLKSQMEKLEGVNSQLREQLRRARIEEDKANVQMQRFKTRIQTLETQLTAFKQGELPPAAVTAQVAAVTVAPIVPQTTAMTASSTGVNPAESLAKLNTQLIHCLEELDIKTRACKSLKTDVEKFHTEYETAKHQVGLLYEDYFQAQAEWREEREELNKRIDKLEEGRDAYASKITEYENHLQVLEQGAADDQVRLKLADTARKVALLKSNEAVLTRRYKAVEARDGNL